MEPSVPARRRQRERVYARSGLDLRRRIAHKTRVTTEWEPRECDLTVLGAAQADLHARAGSVARERFGRQVFVRAVVEVSNYCRENCHYCGMRRENRSLDRYRARFEELAELLIHRRPASVTDVNIQAGEDPVAVRTVVLPLVKALKQQTSLGISVCLGTLPVNLTADLQLAGASVYIIKFELADAPLYERLEAPGTLSERLAFIHHLASQGWQVSSGFIAGLPGQTLAATVQNLHLASHLPLTGCSVSPFIPGEETPLAAEPQSSVELSLNCMAAMRLMRPNWIIPAVSALNLAEPSDGYRRGLRTGANLCTINLTPESLRSDYLLYRRERYIMSEERILAAIAAEGLSVSQQSIADYLK